MASKFRPCIVRQAVPTPHGPLLAAPALCPVAEAQVRFFSMHGRARSRPVASPLVAFSPQSKARGYAAVLRLSPQCTAKRPGCEYTSPGRHLFGRLSQLAYCARSRLFRKAPFRRHFFVARAVIWQFILELRRMVVFNASRNRALFLRVYRLYWHLQRSGPLWCQEG